MKIRSCYLCENNVIMTQEAYERNGGTKKQWDSKFVRLICCSCFDTMRERDNDTIFILDDEEGWGYTVYKNVIECNEQLYERYLVIKDIT